MASTRAGATVGEIDGGLAAGFARRPCDGAAVVPLAGTRERRPRRNCAASLQRRDANIAPAALKAFSPKRAFRL